MSTHTNSQSPPLLDPHGDDLEVPTVSRGASTASIAARRGAITLAPDQPLALNASGGPLLNPRSCVTCRRRKVRCDKQMPCSNCRRAHIQCIFPAPGRAPRRSKPKDPNAPAKGAGEREAELMKRLHKLEGIVEELSGQIEVESGSGSGSNQAQASSSGTSPETGGTIGGGERHGHSGAPKAGSPSSGIAADPAAAMRSVTSSGRAETSEQQRRNRTPEATGYAGVHKQLGRLVLHDKGKTSRYVSSAFWAKLNDELDYLRNEVDSLSEDSEDAYEGLTPDHSPQQGGGPASSSHHGYLLGYSSTDVDLRQLHPLPNQALLLWQVYQENVEPLLKVLHVPTMDRLMRGVGRRLGELSHGDEALVFSIYYAAIVSMEDANVQSNFGLPRSQLLSQYRFALEQALAKANFLNTSDLAVLQAFALFLIVVRRQDDARTCWTLTALCTRMAIGLGIHRDGVELGLPPFEVEMRRRLWWCIMSLELRGAEELGTDLIISHRFFDTELPSNINDADIDPSSTEMPEPRDGRTDCAASIVRYEICALARRLQSVSAEAGPVKPEDVASNLVEREGMLVEVFDRVDSFLKRCVPEKDPLIWVAALVARIVMAKIGLVIYQPVLFPGSGPQLSSEIRDRLFASTIEIVEYSHILNADQRCKQWRWLFETYRQWHAIAYMLLEMSRRPWTPTLERAWEAAQILSYDTSPNGDAGYADHTAVWIPVKKLYMKAKRHREAEIKRLRNDPAAVEQLDLQGGLDPLPERFGPIPGMEMRISQVRARWRKLVQSEDAGPGNLSSFMGSATAPGFGQYSAAPAEAESPAFGGAPSATSVPSVRSFQQPTEVADALLTQNYPPGDMWQYIYQANPSISGPESSGFVLSNPSEGQSLSVSSMESPVAPGREALSKINMAATGDLSRQQGMAFPMGPQQMTEPSAMAGFSGNDVETPPWLWPDTLATESQFRDMQTDDVDVSMDFGEEFDWQNWQEQLRGLENRAMTSTANNGTGRWGGL